MKTSSRRKPAIEKLADKITEAIGSTKSIVLHTIVFVGIFSLLLFGVSIETILLVVTTLVSFEAIYLAIFIQRSSNKQSRRLERAISEIRRSTVIHSKRPLDVVVEEIDREVDALTEKLNSKDIKVK